MYRVVTAHTTLRYIKQNIRSVDRQKSLQKTEHDKNSDINAV